MEGGGCGGNGTGAAAAPRRLGTRQGAMEAVGGGGKQGQRREEKGEGDCGGGGNGDGVEGGGSVPLVGKGEALALDKLPWRL